MIGNSSSGVLESAALKLPVINIGDRQKGRNFTKNVINLKSEFNNKDFKKKLSIALSLKFKKSLKDIKDPNYIKGCSLKMIKIIKQMDLNRDFAKKFYDVRF